MTAKKRVAKKWALIDEIKRDFAAKKNRPDHHIAFTLDERDRINMAKERIPACVEILNPDSHGGADWMFQEAEKSAHGFAYDILRESIDTIDAVFDAAEKRERAKKFGKAA